MTSTQGIDQAKLEAFVGKGISDFGAALSSALVVIGDKLGLYRAMAGAGPLSSTELAQRTGTTERYIRDWLINQAAGGYVEYDPSTGRYTLPNEHAVALTDETSPYFLAGCFQGSVAVVKAEDRVAEAIRTGGGVPWGEQDPAVFMGTERLWGPGYHANLVQQWIPALDGVAAKLEAGASVADIGCGHGLTTIIMGQAYPRSRVIGFDNHAPSIARARRLADEAGVSEQVRFEAATSTSYPGANYDLIAFFDCLHDMGDPLGALRHARERLTPDGTVLLVEPMAGRTVEENFNPIGRAFSGFSVLCCMANGIAECHCDTVLGTVAADDAYEQVAAQAGFSQVRRAAETPFNRVFELRP